MATIVDRRTENEETILIICDFSPPRGPNPQLLEPAAGLDVQRLVDRLERVLAAADALAAGVVS